MNGCGSLRIWVAEKSIDEAAADYERKTARLFAISASTHAAMRSGLVDRAGGATTAADASATTPLSTGVLAADESEAFMEALAAATGSAMTTNDAIIAAVQEVAAAVGAAASAVDAAQGAVLRMPAWREEQAGRVHGAQEYAVAAAVNGATVVAQRVARRGKAVAEKGKVGSFWLQGRVWVGLTFSFSSWCEVL